MVAPFHATKLVCVGAPEPSSRRTVSRRGPKVSALPTRCEPRSLLLLLLLLPPGYARLAGGRATPGAMPMAPSGNG